jgi:hypothetical protein
VTPSGACAGEFPSHQPGTDNTESDRFHKKSSKKRASFPCMEQVRQNHPFSTEPRFFRKKMLFFSRKTTGTAQKICESNIPD